MGDRATLRMARQELEDLYLGLGVPDESVDLTFKDLPSAATADDGGGEKNLLVRSSTNIFAYKLHHDEQPAGLRLSPNNNINNVVDHDDDDEYQQQQHRRQGRAPANYKRRPGIPHSNICALCSSYVYLFRHRCLVCGRVYCRRCVGAAMGEMTEGRKCIDCLGRRYSHRYIHRAGTKLTGAACCCFWGYYPDAQAVKVQELVWAEKGPAPRRRPRPFSSSSASISTSTSASMSMTMSINNGGFSSTRPAVLAPAASTPSSSFISASSPNPHAFPL
ncbi:hypothetical protein E2562_034975 [Oryza meyeriana var. granulata]|uniref:Uncharacterized protein n=1 Tax=Oryza meyeriana var. granulata TaxID=110450 RepID=A0A6G1FF76_9ORYZ|nr:hypothetical protein E2562_034975 [Oryza meyeriana var. granulata]